MKRVITLLFSCFFVVPFLLYAGYDLTLRVGDTKNTPPLEYGLKILNINESVAQKLINPYDDSDIIDEDVKYTAPKNGDFIERNEFFHFRIFDNSLTIESDGFKGEIIFDVINHRTQEVLDQVPLQWEYNNGKLKFSQECGTNFCPTIFQNNLPRHNQRTGITSYIYEIGLQKITEH